MSFDRLGNTAMERNGAFFDKLRLPTWFSRRVVHDLILVVVLVVVLVTSLA